MHRCLTASLALTLFASVGIAQSTWTGATSSDWFDGSNWSPAGVPTATTDVVIPHPLANDPDIAAGTTAVCRNIHVQGGLFRILAGATLDCADCDLDGNLQLIGTLNCTGTTFSALLSTIFDTGSITVQNAATVHFGTFVNFAGSLSAPNATTLDFDDHFLMSSGATVSAPNARLDVEQLGVVAGASVTVGAHLDHTLSGVLTVHGMLNLGTPSKLLFTGDSGVNGSGTSLPDVEFDGTSFSLTGATLQSFTQVAGSGLVNVQGATILGDFTVIGELSGGVSAVLDVDGDVTVTATTPGTLGEIYCSGNWTSDANFAPTSGIVIFDGTAPQTITTPSGAFYGLSIGSGATVQGPTAPLDVANLLFIQGTLVTNGPSIFCNTLNVLAGLLDADSVTTFDVGTGVSSVSAAVTAANATEVTFINNMLINGSFTAPNAKLECTLLDVGTNATLVMGSSPDHRVTLRLNAQNAAVVDFAAPSTITFDHVVGGPVGGFTLASNLSLPDIVFQGSGQFNFGQGTVASFTQTTGDGTVAAIADSTTITGDCTITGYLTGSLGELDVGGDVTINASSTVTTPPDFNVAGNWTSNANFAPTTSFVRFNGTGTQTVTMPEFRFWSVQVVTGAHAVCVGSGAMHVDNSFSLFGGSLTCDCSTFYAGWFSSNGTLDLPAATTIQLGDVPQSLGHGIGGTFTANSATLIDIDQFFGVSGTLDAPNATLDFVRSMTVSGGGSVTLADNATHSFAGQLIAFQTPITLNFGANSTIAFSDPPPIPGFPIPMTPLSGFSVGTLSLPDIVFTGSGEFRMGPGTIASFSQPSGDGTVIKVGSPIFGPDETVILGDMLLTGALEGEGDLVIDVLGDATLNLNIASDTVPTIECASDWVSNANFTPITGSVVFDGAGPQTVTASSLILNSLDVANDQLTLNLTNLTLNDTLTVQADFDTPPGSLDVNGDCIVDPGATLDVSTGTNTVAGNVTNDGLITDTGDLILDGDADVTVVGAGTFGKVEVAKQANATVEAQGTIQLTSDLELTSGVLDVTGTVVVDTDANLTGGTLSGSGVIDIAGNADFTGLTAGLDVPNVQIAGDYVADGTFVPTGGLVEFDGEGEGVTSSLTSTTGQIHFFDVAVRSGEIEIPEDIDIAVENLVVIEPEATVTVRGAILDLSNGGVSSGGVLQVTDGGTIALGDGVDVDVPGTGVLRMVGTFQQPVVMESSGGIPFDLYLDGGIEVVNAEFRGMGSNGVRIGPNAQLGAPPLDMRSCLFADGQGPLLNVQDGPGTFEIRYARFENNTATATANVRAANRPVRLVNWDGPFAGPAFEDDPNGVIEWAAPEQTGLQTFAITPSVGAMRVTFATDGEVDSAGYRLMRATTPAGPFFEVAAAAAGLGHYDLVDQDAGVMAMAYSYRLDEELLHGELRELANGGGTPLPSSGTLGTRGFVVTPNGPFRTIGDALQAAPAGVAPNILVEAGTYPRFKLDRPAHIVAHGPGEVVILTTDLPVQIQDIPAGLGSEVVLSGLRIRGGAGLVVENVLGRVFLDDLVVESGFTPDAITLEGCPQVSLHSCEVRSGTTHLLGGAVAYIARGELQDLFVEGIGTNCELFDVTPSAATTATGGTIGSATTGTAPRIDFPVGWGIDTDVTIDLTGDPAAQWFALLGVQKSFLPFPVLYDWLLLLDPGISILQIGAGGFTPDGTAELTLHVPPGQVVGQGFPLQVLVLQPSAQLAFGNVRDLVFLP